MIILARQLEDWTVSLPCHDAEHVIINNNKKFL